MIPRPVRPSTSTRRGPSERTWRTNGPSSTAGRFSSHSQSSVPGPSGGIEMSQGSHFFHNISSFGVSYFSLPPEGPGTLDWEWLENRPAVEEGPFVRHVRSDGPLRVEVDGRTGRG